ncbi:serine protease Hayan-like isoform X2 [Diabrotica virgifera virgifera]|uniref:Peptidase S1 domain-containing protein n=2 Tax=Diabrotica virgifera virgifera TaxID=50390 RepID=A0ABM5JT59_DIAVI|nr:serine protease Hayan-like isoform X2 [Diabrotica virgifera virgifera]
MHLHLLILTCVLKDIVTQVPDPFLSPCPRVFYYEPQKEVGKWFGVMKIYTTEKLTGIWLTVKLDRKAELLGNWFGETYSSDNIEFRISNPDYVLEAIAPISIRFFVKYNPIGIPPKLEIIRLNGLRICPQQREILDTTTAKLHISKPKPTRPSTIVGSSSSLNNDAPLNNFNSQTVEGDHISDSSLNIDKPDVHIPSTGTNNDRNRYPVNTKPVDHPSLGYNVATTGDYGTNVLTGSDGTHKNFETKLLGTNTQNPNTIPKREVRPPSLYNGLNVHENRSPRRIQTPSDNSYSNDSEEDFFPGDFNAGISASTENHVTRPLLEKQPNVACGTVALKPKAFIAYGQDTTPGQWPWHAAVYHTKGITLMYICGASLISQTHLLIAAHCLTKPRTAIPVEPEGLLVYFGKYNLRTFGPETQDRNVEQIIIHPHFNSSIFSNDIGIIKLSRPVEITDYVRPVCLWEDDTNLETIINKDGTVVGWGFDENKKISEKLMQAKMPVVSTIQCIYSNRDFFARFTSDSNFCAGFRNGTSVCNGDSGGSMVFPKKSTSGQNPVWQIRGIVSVGVALQTEGICDTSQYVIFTDVAKFLPWIKGVINSN